MRWIIACVGITLLTSCTGLTDGVTKFTGVTASVLGELQPTLGLIDERLGEVALEVASISATAHEATVTASAASEAAGEGKDLGIEEWSGIAGSILGAVYAGNLIRNQKYVKKNGASTDPGAPS